MKSRIIVILTALCLILSISSCDGKASAVQEDTTGTACWLNTGLSSDIVRTDVHEDITWDLITLAEHNPELKSLLEKSILQAAEENPDTDTNPVVSLDSYYQFIDRIVRSMPWEISPYGSYSSLYSRIDQ